MIIFLFCPLFCSGPINETQMGSDWVLVSCGGPYGGTFTSSSRTVVQTPGVRAGRRVNSGKPCIYVRQEEALPAGGNVLRRTGGDCARVCIWKRAICLMGKVRLRSSPTRLPSACNKQTNNNTEPSRLLFQDKRATLERKVCSL